MARGLLPPGRGSPGMHTNGGVVGLRRARVPGLFTPRSFDSWDLFRWARACKYATSPHGTPDRAGG